MTEQIHKIIKYFSLFICSLLISCNSRSCPSYMKIIEKTSFKIGDKIEFIEGPYSGCKGIIYEYLFNPPVFFGCNEIEILIKTNCLGKKLTIGTSLPSSLKRIK